jgi:ferric-dicitrate binding protein FerR (iron transport regulator)
MPIFPRSSTAAPPHDPCSLRGARRRARELGILDEFWEFVSNGDVPSAMDMLALRELLEKERARRRRARVLAALVVAALCVVAGWWLSSPTI